MLEKLRNRWNIFCFNQGIENQKKMESCIRRKDDLLLEIIILENIHKASKVESITFSFPFFYDSLFDNNSLLIASLRNFCITLYSEINKYKGKMHIFYSMIF